MLPPPPQNWLRCSKLEVADQQLAVVNSRSWTNKVCKLKLSLKFPMISIIDLINRINITKYGHF